MLYSSRKTPVEAQKNVINDANTEKVLDEINGELDISKDSNAARTAVKNSLGVELTQGAGAENILSLLNGKAKEIAKVKEQQAALRMAMKTKEQVEKEKAQKAEKVKKETEAAEKEASKLKKPRSKTQPKTEAKEESNGNKIYTAGAEAEAAGAETGNEGEAQSASAGALRQRTKCGSREKQWIIRPELQ